MYNSVALLSALAASVSAGTILWDGRFNDLSSSSDLNNWSWGNQVGPYQYYIHGSSPVTSYINLSPDYKNPADTGSSKGSKFTIDSTSYWNGQTMRRTELIPQTSAAINKGHVFYHFSMKRTGTNAPVTFEEHQVNFFESHFTEMKYGWISGAAGTDNPNLQWMVSQQSKWSTPWTADVWHNIAYEIDFSANTCAFWHSTGSDPLVLTVPAVSCPTSSNGADWHLGVLRLPRSGFADQGPEDWYFSGVYIESGTITTSVAGPGSNPPPPPPPSSTRVSSATPTPTPTSTPRPSSTLVTSARPSSSSIRVSSAAPSSTATPGGCTAQKWAQCGGNGFTGCKTCAAGSTCKFSNDWYSQCL